MAEEKIIWGVHMEWHHELKALEGNYIAIGWPKVGDLAKLNRDREAFKKAVRPTYPTAKDGEIPVLAGTLFRFATEMKSRQHRRLPFKAEPNGEFGHLTGGLHF